MSSPDPPPVFYGTGSSARLILLPNTDDGDDEERAPYTTAAAAADDDDDDENENENDPIPLINQLPIPPLSPSVVFLYLLTPYLRLGAVFASGFRGASLAHSLLGLVVAATLSGLCRQIWFLLGRHLRKSSTEEILIYTFARHRRRFRRYGLARFTSSIVSALFKVLLAAMYLRASVDAVLSLKFPKSTPFPSRFNVSVVLSILLFVLSLPKSMASKTVIYSTGLSVASYVAWLVALSRSSTTNDRLLLHSFKYGVLWNEITSFAFACTTAMTVPLAASLAAGTPLAPPSSRDSSTRSFELLNVSSTVLAALLILPLAFIAASPREPVPAAPPDVNIILGLRIAILVFAIPSVIVSIVSLPIYGVVHRFIHSDLALSVITVAIFALSLVPPNIASVLDDVTLFLAIFGAFLLPALAHITTHYFRRPLSIVVPRASSSAAGARTPNRERSPSPSRDPLLQRKERLLQRRRFGRRLLWDVIVWIVLIPTCGVAFVWVVGRLAGRW